MEHVGEWPPVSHGLRFGLRFASLVSASNSLSREQLGPKPCGMNSHDRATNSMAFSRFLDLKFDSLKAISEQVHAKLKAAPRSTSSTSQMRTLRPPCPSTPSGVTL